MRPKLGFRVLGPCALLMAMMTIGTPSAAHAETGACFGYPGGGIIIDFPGGKVLPEGFQCFGGSLEPLPAVQFENKTSTLLISFVNLEVLCTGAAVVEGGQLGAN